MRQRIWQIFVIVLVLVNLVAAGGAGIQPALAAVQPASRQALTFTPEEVDPNAVRGLYSAITVDGEGVPHIAYHDSTNGDLLMASKHGASWLREEVDADSSNTTVTGVTPSIVIDADGLAHIAYYDQTNGDLRYARQLSPDGWVTGDAVIKVDTTGDVGWGASLALDSLQRPHVAYRDTSNHALKYAYFDGAAWQIASVTGATDFWANSSVSLALTSGDLPRIAYRRSSGIQTVLGLGYASFDGASWSVETAVAAASVGEAFSLALDSRNVPHISYMDNSVGLRYTTKSPAWTPETVVANTTVGSLNNLALDPAGRVRIVYFDASVSPNTIKYAYKDGATWRHELLANTASAPDLVLDANGGAHISYMNTNNKQGYIRLAPFPDVQVSDVWLVGTTIHFQLYNSGLGTAPAGYKAVLSVNNVSKVATLDITDPIPAGGRIERSFSYTYSCTPLGALIPVKVDADSGAVIAEITRSNNTRQETWTCKGVKPVITVGPIVTGVTTTTATIEWSTNTNTDATIDYGRRAGLLNGTVINTPYQQIHSIMLSSLTPGASYAFQVTSMDQTRQSVTSDVAFFTTASPGGSVSPLVTRSLKKDDGPGEVYTLKASVPGATGLEKVEFFYRLTPTSPLVLIGTAFGGTPAAGGSVEFATKFSPGKTNLSRQQLNGANIITSVSIPGGSAQVFEDLFTPLNTPPPVVSITSPNPDYTIYVDSWPTSGKKLMVKAHAEAYEWDCDWSGTDTIPDCDNVRKPVDKIRLWVDFATPFEIIPTADQYDFEHEFTLPGSMPMDYQAYAQAFSGDAHISTHVPAHIKVGTPVAILERAVTRVGNTFHVVFTIKNDATATGSLFVNGLYDYVRGFQPIFDDVGDVKVTSSYTPSTRINQMYFDLDQGSEELRTIPIGGSYSFSYDLIPVIYENNVQYAIGEVNVTSLVYKVGSDERFQYFNLPVSTLLDPSPAMVTLANSVAKALKEDDYLLVTHPANLKSVYGSQTAEPNWNTLLRRMAELADLRQGALAYLDSQDAETLNDLLEPEYHVWADKLHPNYSKYAQGYVLLVGEDNIVPSYTKTGLEGGTVKLTDNPFAHTGGSGAPDLVLGRLPGNDIPQLIAPIVTSLKVLRGELINDRSKALGTSGTGDGIQDFQDAAESAKSNLQSLGVTVSLFHQEQKARTATISIPFDDGDLLTSGDIDGDGDQELLIGDVSTDDIYAVYITDQGYNRVKLFHYPEDIKSGHGFATGDLDGDSKDELVIADDIDRLFVYRCPLVPSPCDEANPPDTEFFVQPFDNWDKLAIGNVDGDPEKELIIAHAGNVTMRNGIGTPAGTQFPMAFSAEDDMAVGRVWNDDAIVEIVLMDASANEGRIYTVNGTLSTQFPAVYSEGDFVIAADVDGAAGDTKPEEVWVLNSSGNAIQGYYAFGSDPKAVYIPQRVIEGDKIAALKLAGDMRPAIWLVKRDDNTYRLDRDYPEYMQTLYLNAATEADYLYYNGHGNSQAWENVKSDMNPVPNFGTAAPLAYGQTCSSGDYSPDKSASLSERMLWWGSGAFIGSTEVSYRDFNVNAAEWFSNHFKDQGPFNRLLVEYKNKKWDDGSIYANCDWPYWVHEYNFYGDAKFGFIGDTTALPYPDAAPRLLETDTLTVNLPAYTVTQKDGYDYVDIPDGDVTTNEGELRIPYYVETKEYPAGTRVSGVTLTARGGKTITTGLYLPLYTLMLDGNQQPVTTSKPIPPADEMDWTPMQDQVFTWNVVERADGTSQLVIRLHPFYYSPSTTAVEYYTSYDFSIETTAAKQEITRLTTDKAIYRLNEPVQVDAQIKNSSTGAANLLVSASLFNAGGSPVSGADMRLLNSLAGDSSTGYNTAFDTNALPAGSYYVQMEIREPAGRIIDTETSELELGMRAAQVEVSASPTLFKPGNPVALQLAVSNIGDLLLSGAMAEVVVLDEAGVVVASFSQLVADLAAGASTSVPFTWNTTGATDWRYTVQGRVLYGSQSSPEDSVDVVTHALLYLPVIARQ